MVGRSRDLLRKFVILLAATYFPAEVVDADVFSFKSVQFNGEYNGGPNSYSQLSFTIDRPTVGPFSYSTKSKVSFTLDTDLSGKLLRTDLRFRNDWLTTRWFNSTSKTEMYLGTVPLNAAQLRDLNSLLQNEKKLAAWIVANSDELIDYALASNKYIPAKSRRKWKNLSRNNTFETNIRKNLGRGLKSEISEYDKYAKHTPRALKDVIQPSLKKLGYYDDKVDGLWGIKTKNAIMNFEHDNGLFPDGVNYGSDRRVLVRRVDDELRYSDVVKNKERELENKKIIGELTLKLSSSNSEITKLKKYGQVQQETINRLYGQIAELEKSKSGSEDILNLEKELAQAKLVAKRQSSIAVTRLEQIKKYQSEIKNLKQQKSLNQDIKKLETDLKYVKELSAERLDTILRLNKKIAEINKSAVPAAEIKDIQNELKIALDKLAFFQSENKNLTKQLTQLKATQDIVNTELAEQVEKLDREKQQLTKELADVKSQIDSSDFLPVFQLSEEWLEVERFLAVQQVRFCQILSNYSIEAKAAAESKNQLRQNLVATNRDNDIAALIPNGNYNDWVAKVVEIYATPSGDAAFVLRLPCDVTFGSGKLNGAGDLDGSYAATAEFGGIIYNQLAQLAQGDTVLISGKILTYEDIGALNQRLKFITNLNGNNPSKSEPRRNRAAPDYFSEIDYLSKL